MLKPLGEYIAVMPTKRPKKTSKGIYLPDKGQKLQPCGKVLAVGQGKRIDHEEGNQVVPSSVRAGNLVIWNEFAGIGFRLHGEEVVLLKEADILAVMEP